MRQTMIRPMPPGRTSRPGRSVLLAGMCALALLASACTDDEADDASNGSGTTGEETTVDLSVLGEPMPAEGEPVVIGFGAAFGDEGQGAGAQQLLEGTEVAIQYQNEYANGIAGRPIELRTCDLGALPETAVDCANQFVEEDVVAVLVPAASNGGSVVPIVTGAGIPYVSAAAGSLEELATENAFSLAGGGLGGTGAVVLDAAENGYETISHVLIDVPQVTLVASAVGDPLFEAAGAEQELILAPLGTPDLTAQLSTATGDAMGLITGDSAICASALQGVPGARTRHPAVCPDDVHQRRHQAVDPRRVRRHPPGYFDG